MRRSAAALLFAGLVLTACGGVFGGEEPETVDRSAFIATYVDLRIAALRTDGTLDPTRRQAILSEHGVTEEELLEFAEIHGRDPAFMRDLWSDVEQKLDSARMAGGVGPGSGTP